MPSQPKPRQEISTLDRQQLEGVLFNRSPGLSLAIALLWYTGIRVSELCQLTWTNADIFGTNRPLLTLPASITKTRTPRVIPLPLPIVRRLEQHAAASENQLPLVKPEGFIINHRKKTDPYSTRAIQYALEEASRSLGIAHITPHSFRHSFATRMLRVSNIRITQLALGHRSITSTAIYTHPTLDEIEQAMTKAALED
jgi:integrase/recombinase XerD